MSSTRNITTRHREAPGTSADRRSVGGATDAEPNGASRRTVRLVTLGCARNEVDSEELAGRLTAAGWTVTDEDDDAAVVLVNTCGFIDAAKRESIDELLTAAESGAKVAAVGCLAERYGVDLANALPEAQILSFDDYDDIAARLDDVLAGRRRPAHTPRDRRTLLPITPAWRPPAGRPAGQPPAAARTLPPPPAAGTVPPDLPPGVAPPSGPRVVRRRLSNSVVSPLKIASGCDRRCTFCAIPAFRGAFVSRPPSDVLIEARWLAEQGARELVLVSENSTSYGKDLGDLRLLEKLLPQLAAVPGITRVRVSYLQPAEMRPGLVGVLTSTPGVAPYFDLSFQHASGRLLRAMRRFGDRHRFLALLDMIRHACPEAGIRSNFIVGFPGETDADLRELELFWNEAELDAIGVFGYSDEDGTAAASLPDKIPEAEIARRVADLADLADELMAQRARARIGQIVDVLVEERRSDGVYEGRAAHQAPEVDGTTVLRTPDRLAPGDIVRARVVSTDGVDLVADAVDRGSTTVGPAPHRTAPVEPPAGGARDGGPTGSAAARRSADLR